LDRSFFGKKFFEENERSIRTLTYSDCFSADNFKQLHEFHEFGLPLTQVIWLRLRSALSLAKEKFSSKPLDNNQPIIPRSVEDFLKSFKKGSKKFREIIDKSVYDSIDVNESTAITTFCSVTGLEKPPKLISEYFLGSWNQTFLDNDLREFIFKCRYNLLKTNDRLSHILQNVEQDCFLCKCLFIGTAHRETFAHLFRSCPVMFNLIGGVIRKLKIDISHQNLDFNQLYWFGNRNGELDRSSLLFFDILRYHVWCCKLRKTFPSEKILTCHIISSLQTIFRVKPSIRKTFLNNNILSGILQVTG
jgi:hypothetical protein